MEEAATLQRFKGHPNIVTVLDFFRANQTAYLVMEYVDGSTLAAYLSARNGRISFDSAMLFLLPVMDGLEAVHSAKVWHRDISPDNIYLSRSGPVKILDFGSTRNDFARNSKSQQVRSQQVFLKPGFTPFEQYSTTGNQGPWTDEYALAATLYRCVTGKVPPESSARKDNDLIMPPGRLGVAIPPECEAALMKALAVNPEGRFGSIAEFRKAMMPKPAIVSERRTAPIVPAAAKLESSGWVTSFAALWILGGGFVLAASAGSRIDQGELFLSIAFLFMGFMVVASAFRKAWMAIQDEHANVSPGMVIPLVFLPVVGALEVVRGFQRNFNAFATRHSPSTPRLSSGFFTAFPFLATTVLVALIASVFDHALNPALMAACLLASGFAGCTVLVRMCDAVNALTAQPPPQPRIRALSGEFAGGEIPIGADPLVIGRNKDFSNLVLSSVLVSRKHLQVWNEYPGAGIWIQDLNSTHGTYYLSRTQNGQGSTWVRVQGRQLLRNGEQFRVGTDPEVFEVCDT
jgi:hypothetical protein